MEGVEQQPGASVAEQSCFDDQCSSETSFHDIDSNANGLAEVLNKENLKLVLHQIQVYLVQFWDYLRSIDYKNDTFIALAVGLVAGISILVFLAYNPGEPFDYTKEDGGKSQREKIRAKIRAEKEEAKRDKVKDGENQPEELKNETKASEDMAQSQKRMQELDEEEFLRKGEKFQKMFGLSEEQMRQAVRDANTEIRTGKTPADFERRSWVRTFDTVVILGGIGAFLYFANRDYDGVVLRFFKALLPKETQVLGL
mmetsp:Transcript_6877/g.12132  ORF Transcript_6877/g.12132 Transcript_6877/m.12132 type:complete len:255 (-) Transcript_6877:144-908(-)